MEFMPLANEIYKWAQQKGFYDPPLHPGVKLMLIVTELSEAFEDVRSENQEHEGEEIADVLIRLLDYAAWRGIDLDHEVARKMEINRGRPYKHGKNF